MRYLELCQLRNSEHNFDGSAAISDTDFEIIMESVRLTPSGYNAQPWHFILVRNPKKLEEIQQIAFGQKHITKAKNAVIVLGNTKFSETEYARILSEWKREKSAPKSQLDSIARSLKKERSAQQWKEMTMRNSAFAAQSFLMAAADAGFSTCPMMGFDQKKLLKCIHAPDAWIPILLIALGKSHNKNKQMPRKSVSEITSYESF